ncbi:MAG: sigma 54-interacting transcriptional regulator [Candidatus Acidiferrales bacterium]
MNPEPNSRILPEEVLFGRSPTMAELRGRAGKICTSNIPVLLQGDGGTGKEALARWIHAHSEFRTGEFVKVNCAAIPGTLLESELFGYEQGAFTGAQAPKPGLVELAQNGTLYLDEISDLDRILQSKLLHFMQDGSFSRIGGEAQRTVNTRIICSTHKDLEKEIAAGNFRADLFYRINVLRLRLPRLSERREDIPALVEYFRTHYEQQFAKESKALDPEMLQYLQNLNWSGNIRELSNYIARYVIIGPEAAILQELPRKRTALVRGTSGEAETVSLKRIAKEAIREMERKVILETLRANQWNRRKTAQALKISYRALIYKIRDAGLISRRASLLTGTPQSGARAPQSSND